MSLTAPRALRILLFPLGLALPLAVVLLQGGTALTAAAQAPATPTPDRLAEPTLPAVPSQADYGAQVYWLNCLACHGDRGQGLTAEFRDTYPPEDRNCWGGGCHGKRPYADGFTLPERVPALIGNSALKKFPTAANLQGYISAAMPYWRPGSVAEQDTWAATAFLLRENGYWAGRGELNSANASSVAVGEPLQPTPTTTPSVDSRLTEAPGSGPAAVAGAAALAGLVIFLAVRAVRQGRKSGKP